MIWEDILFESVKMLKKDTFTLKELYSVAEIIIEKNEPSKFTKTWESTLSTILLERCNNSGIDSKRKHEESFTRVGKGVYALIKTYEMEEIEIKEIEQDLEQYKEGQTNKRVVVSNKTVRNPKLRRDYLNHLQKEDKLQCEICGEYKDDKEMLDVHHILEISNYAEVKKTHSTFNDVIALCPCCHRKIHLGRVDIKIYKIN